MAKSIRDNTKRRRGRPVTTGKGTLVGVRLQPAHLVALDAWIAKQDAPLTRPEANTGHDGDDPAYPLERHGREAVQEGEYPMKESTLSKITASVAVARGMAQRALAASPNPQWTEYEMQSVDEWIARQDVKLDRSEAIRRLVEIGLKVKR
jgi:hypothetical protein